MSSHVLPALMRKCHEAKVAGEEEVVIWGSGRPMREFLHADDVADACLHLMRHYEGAEHVNVGTGEDITIRELAETMRDIVHPTARLVFDDSKPDGMMRKVLDVSKLHELGWHHRIGFREGVEATYRWFEAQDPAAIRGMSDNIVLA
jgi:GDP-L-fucose synthase